MDRRDFLATVPLTLIANAIPHSDSMVVEPLKNVAGNAATTSPGSTPHELDFATALQAAEAIRSKKVSSLELTRRVFERIDRYNPQLNAFAYQLREDALAQAKRADEAQAQGRSLGVFHGVPINVKESFAVAGHPCTWGIPALRDSKAPTNSDVVNRLSGAGAVLIGATNLRVNLADG